jgi:circadian clock protein KaiC
MADDRSLPKAPTGVTGLDEVTGGGLPQGRPTLVCGSAGCGKTILAMEFLVRGAKQFGEPGVFMAFEETGGELEQNVASLGWDLPQLAEKKQLTLDHVHIERAEILETGEYDLEGLFVRLGYAIDSIQAKRVVLDTIEALFAGLANQMVLRSELRRLFRWLKDKGVTAIITAERGDGTLTRHGLEEYVSDCVILLDHRVTDQLSTRRLRIVKYRGSRHGTNEYPFFIGEHGCEVYPITSLGLQHPASTERISTGVHGLDAMFEGTGLYRGSTVLISGAAGSGKSSLAAHAAYAACQRGEPVVYVAAEESADQIVRNMRSIGLDLRRHLTSGRLRFHAVRPSAYGLELHLATVQRVVTQLSPQLVVVDPVTSYSHGGTVTDVEQMLIRLVDFLKARGTTAFFTSLMPAGSAVERTDVGISSIIDTWIVLQDREQDGERNRTLHVVKARGLGHSNQIREFRLSGEGITLSDVYVGPGKVLTGSARLAQEARDRAEAVARQQAREQLEGRRAALERSFEARLAQLRAEHEAVLKVLDQQLTQHGLREQSWERRVATQRQSRDERPLEERPGEARPRSSARKRR